MARSLTAWLSTAAVLLAPIASAAGTTSYNGLALMPQMGWDNWNAFACDISEEMILSTAQKIVDYGLRDLGTNVIAIYRKWDANDYLKAITTSFSTTAGLLAVPAMAPSSPT